MTAVDTNILSDILAGAPLQAAESRRAILVSDSQGVLITSIISFAELAGSFGDSALLKEFLSAFPILVSPLDEETAFLAGKFYKEYRARGGPRTRILPDFLIAAHAQIHADRILTRDHRFFGTNFPSLKAVAPEDLQ